MSDIKLHRPSKEFLRILRSVGAEGEIFTRQQVLFYLREYVIVNRLLDPDNPRLVSLKGDPLACILGRLSFAIDDIESLIDEIPSRFDVPKRCEDNCWSLEKTHIDSSHRSPTSLAKDTDISAPSSVSSFRPLSTSPDRLRRRAASLDAESFIESSLQHPSISLPLLAFSSSSLTTSIQDSKDGFTTSWPPWFCAVQRLTTTSVTSDEKSEVLSLQGYETAPVEDSSDDLWYLDTSPSATEARVVSPIEDVEDSFQVEFEVDSDTEVDEDLEEDSEEDDDQEDEEELLLGQENSDFAFLSRVAGNSARNDSDVEFWADHSSDDDDDDSEEEGVEFEFEEEDRLQRRLVEGEASDSSDSEADFESDQEKWECPECLTCNRPYVRFCERCWKLRPGWLMSKLNMPRLSETKSEGGEEDDNLRSRLLEEEEEEEESPQVDVEPHESDDSDNRVHEIEEDLRTKKSNIPEGLLDFDWDGNFGNTRLVKTDCRDATSENVHYSTLHESNAGMRVTLPTFSTASTNSFAATTTSTASIAASAAASSTASTADDSEFRCESQASLFSQSSFVSLASSRDCIESHNDGDSIRDSGATSSLSTVESQDGVRGNGATSSLSTVDSQDSGFDGSQDNFSRYSVYSPFSRVDGQPSSVRRGNLRRRELDFNDIRLQFEGKEKGKLNEFPIASIKSSDSFSKNFASTSFARSSSTSTRSSTLPASMSLFSNTTCLGMEDGIKENTYAQHQRRRYSFDRSTMGRCPLSTRPDLTRKLVPKYPDQPTFLSLDSSRPDLTRKSVPKYPEMPTFLSLDSTRPELTRKFDPKYPEERTYSSLESFASEEDYENGKSCEWRSSRFEFLPENRPPSASSSSSFLALRADNQKPNFSPLSFNTSLCPETNDTIATLVKTSPETPMTLESDSSFSIADSNSNLTRPVPPKNPVSGEAMAIMDSLPQFDRQRNISGGSSATGSSTEELSATSGDDADLFKRPADRPPFSRKRKDRQSSGSSTASAFRRGTSSSKDRPKAASEHKRGKGHHHPSGIPNRSSTVIFSIRGSSPDRPSQVAPITTRPSTSFSSLASFAFGRSPDALATLLDGEGTTISVNSGSITSFTVKKRSKPKAKRQREKKSQTTSKTTAETATETTSLPPKTTAETSTQCDRVDVPTAESQGPENDADDAQDKCIICLTRPKNASIIHGYLGHQVCCCKCARKLRRLGKPCPICRRPIQHIVKNVIV